MPNERLYSFGSSVYDYNLARTDFALPAEIRREIMLQNNNYPNEETELFDDQEEHILRVWKRIFQEKRDVEKAIAAAATAHQTIAQKITRKPSQLLLRSPPRPPRPSQSLSSIINVYNNKKLPQTRIQKLAEKRASALRPYIRQYVANVDGVVGTNAKTSTAEQRHKSDRAALASSLEGFVARLSEMLFAARTFLAHDVYAVLTYDQDSGWPRAEIWMRQLEGRLAVPRAVNAALEHTKGLLWRLAEEASGGGGGEILPEILRFSWHICSSSSSDGDEGGKRTSKKAEWAWGDRSCHFGALNLVSCLADFPRGDLELGWFGPAESDGEPVDKWLVGAYKKRSRGPVVCGGSCPPVAPLTMAVKKKKKNKWKGGEEGEEEELENARRKERVVKRWKGILAKLRTQRSNPMF